MPAKRRLAFIAPEPAVQNSNPEFFLALGPQYAHEKIIEMLLKSTEEYPVYFQQKEETQKVVAYWRRPFRSDPRITVKEGVTVSGKYICSDVAVPGAFPEKIYHLPDNSKSYYIFKGAFNTLKDSIWVPKNAVERMQKEIIGVLKRINYQHETALVLSVLNPRYTGAERNAAEATLKNHSSILTIIDQQKSLPTKAFSYFGLGALLLSNGESIIATRELNDLLVQLRISQTPDGRFVGALPDGNICEITQEGLNESLARGGKSLAELAELAARADVIPISQPDISKMDMEVTHFVSSSTNQIPFQSKAHVSVARLSEAGMFREKTTIDLSNDNDEVMRDANTL